jgi:outer membrane protein assembly factor BamB
MSKIFSPKLLRSMAALGGLVFASAMGFAPSASGEDWPQWRGMNRDGVWNETGVVEKFPAAEMPIKWKVEIGAGYSGPTVADGRVFVTDRLTKPTEVERILCFEEATGKPLWVKAYDCPYGRIGYQAGPRASVTVEGKVAYALGATGRVFALDVASGEVLWEKNCETEFEIDMPIWGISGAPLIYENLVILHIGGKNACVVALNKQTGEEVWRALPDRAQYTAPIVVKQGDTDVVIVWTGDSASGLDAKTGKVHWNFPWKPRNMPIGIATPIVENNMVFFTSFYDGSLMLRLDPTKPTAEKVWQIAGRDERNTEALHSIISTPLFRGGLIYGCDSYGELRCLDAATGERLWEDLTATPKARWSNIHFVQAGELTWLFNERGELIIGKLAKSGFTEISRTKILEPTLDQLRQRGGVCWSHPAFANRHVFVRNDKELVCVSLEKK